MDGNMKAVIMKRLEKTAENLRKNNFEAYVVNTSAEAVEIVKGLLNDGDTITSGGSMSLEESGVMELMRSGKYNFLDRSKAENREETEEIYRQAYRCDAYLCSSNAVMENGELYNVDGNSNRVSAICYGPKSVIMVCGYNKVVRNLDEAVVHVKTASAPANCLRLGCETYCAEKGSCVSLEKGGNMPSGCRSDGRVCCNYVVSAWQRHKGRIKVILVAEELGY